MPLYTVGDYTKKIRIGDRKVKNGKYTVGEW